MGGALWVESYGRDLMGRKEESLGPQGNRGRVAGTLWAEPYVWSPMGGDPMGGTLWAEPRNRSAHKAIDVGTF